MAGINSSAFPPWTWKASVKLGRQKMEGRGWGHDLVWCLFPAHYSTFWSRNFYIKNLPLCILLLTWSFKKQQISTWLVLSESSVEVQYHQPVLWYISLFTYSWYHSLRQIRTSFAIENNYISPTNCYHLCAVAIWIFSHLLNIFVLGMLYDL